MIVLPILYSFRRCPYAIRARYTLAFLNVSVRLREVVLKSKPDALLALGGRSSVPQLMDCDGTRYPESLDIMFWALSKTKSNELTQQLWPNCTQTKIKIQTWIRYNDSTFKYWLDRYKYADRHPAHSEAYYRGKGEVFLKRLEARLSKTPFLLGEAESLADIAIFPFIRQFAAVNQNWFDSSPYRQVRLWLRYFIDAARFKSTVMVKHTAWRTEEDDVLFPTV
ncbi:glutathione S-transferase [Marinomonas algarum]|uniref:Glutathione S-transferase n=1 Tax=Marinomonas algarum TaxID=2883105 RepID=A0A9X1IRB9_9GAMM|nr:glutathione S-transferase [Marinomonas algarum]MCB5162886.1 glutathione S-transferase [Marinomonas algarum]